MVAMWTWRNPASLLRSNPVFYWVLLSFVCLIFSACGKTVPPPKTLEDLQAQSQERLFQSAKSEYLSQQYTQAIKELRHFASTYPRSRYDAEVTWMLARAYHESGDMKKALMLYERVLSDPSARPHHREARQHLQHLQALSKPPVRDRSDVFALQMTFRQWLQGQDWTARLKNMVSRGVTTQVINLECGLTKEEAAMLFAETSKVETGASGSSSDFLSFVQQSREQGLSVFVGVNIRCLGDLEPELAVEWVDRAYDQKTEAVRSTKYFDVFNPLYQRFLKKTLVQLASFGVDGFVFLGDAPMGIFDGLTPIALAKFQREFGVAFNPKSVFAAKGKSRNRSSRVVLPKKAEFWRWVGWRARTRLKVLEGLMSAVRASSPKSQVALEIYAGSLNDPLRTLLRFNEDILESHNHDFSFFVIDVDGPQQSQSSSSRQGVQSQQESLFILANRLLEVTKDPTKIWLTIPRKMEVKTWSSESLKDLTRGENIPQGIGLIYDLRPFS